jgi:hypothetical protein
LIATHISGLLPFAYPPPFLLIVAPLALGPYWLSFAIWLLVTSILYALVVGGRRELSLAMAHPAVAANFLVGQNGFLTASILGAGLGALPARPFLGGIILGLLVIKPQLALTLPFAMIAGRQWKVIAGGILSASCVSFAALLLFGSSSYGSFLASLPFFANSLRASDWRWNELASVYALMRSANVPDRLALAIQATVALVAIALVCRAWWLGHEERIPMIVPATLLISPYLFTYDALLLAIPLLWLIERRRQFWDVIAIWFLCLLPVASYFALYSGPNTVPIAAGLSIWALKRRVEERSARFAGAQEKASKCGVELL